MPTKLKNILKTKMLKFEITKITQKIQNFLSYLTLRFNKNN